MRFLLKVVFQAVAIWLVTLILPGIAVVSFSQEWWAVGLSYLLVALVFGIINATIGNAIRIIAFPIYLLTLGIVALFVNGALLLLVDWLSSFTGFGLRLESYWWAILGAVLIGFITWFITIITRPLFGDEKSRSRSRSR